MKSGSTQACQAEDIVAVVLFVLGSAISSGLSLGLLSLDLEELGALAENGNDKEQRMAKRCYAVVKDQHWLLVTLLLWNTGFNLCIPMFMERCVGAILSIVLSITIVLIVGDLLPQAICMRHGVFMGAHLNWLVHLVMWVSGPISWPLARLLDLIVGSEHHSVYKHKKHAEALNRSKTTGHGKSWQQDPLLHASHIMTPLEETLLCPLHSPVDLPSIIAQGHSRILVHAPHKRSEVLGVLLVSDLLHQQAASRLKQAGGSKQRAPFPESVAINADALALSGPVHSARGSSLRRIPRLSAHTPIPDILRHLRKVKADMALLTAPRFKHEQATDRSNSDTSHGSRVQQPVMEASPCPPDAPDMCHCVGVRGSGQKSEAPFHRRTSSAVLVHRSFSAEALPTQKHSNQGSSSAMSPCKSISDPGAMLDAMRTAPASHHPQQPQSLHACTVAPSSPINAATSAMRSRTTTTTTTTTSTCITTERITRTTSAAGVVSLEFQEQQDKCETPIGIVTIEDIEHTFVEHLMSTTDMFR